MPQGFYVTTVLQVESSADIDEIVVSLKELKKHVLTESNCTMFCAKKDTLDSRNIVVWERFEEKSDFHEHIYKDYVVKFFDETKVDIINYFQTECIELD